ncbi:hypothetical protein CEXT_337231 [Caerostris extrusa]|uniref:Uncharacterized protein n=1 Tax=Caerostris extrusa TaxID=172846 RepID=A0AAV4NKJ3_CAEEX|nr:hypothetical protein CEXT_337231 [Caerostris extrusa]
MNLNIELTALIKDHDRSRRGRFKSAVETAGEDERSLMNDGGIPSYRHFSPQSIKIPICVLLKINGLRSWREWGKGESSRILTREANYDM